MAVKFQYTFSRYSFQDEARIKAAQGAIDALAADGWRMHTALPNGHELGVVWERPAGEEEPPPTPKRARRVAVPAAEDQDPE